MSQRGKFLQKMKEAILLARELGKAGESLSDDDAKWIKHKLTKWSKENGIDPEYPEEDYIKPNPNTVDDLPF